MRALRHAGWGGAAFFAACATAAPADAPVVLALDELEKGSWEVRMRGPGAPVFNLCLGDARQVIQLRHQGKNCTRYVLEDKPRAVTVHYVCPGAGNGRTSIRIETSRLIQVRSQGIAQGLPFADTGEGRHKGPCQQARR